MKDNNTDDGEQIKIKIKWRFSLSLTIKAGGAGEIWRCVVVGVWSRLRVRAAISGARWVTHPSNNMEGGAIISIFLITRTSGVS